MAVVFNDESMPRLEPMVLQDLPAVHAVECRAYTFPWTYGNFADCLRSGYGCWIHRLNGHPIGHGVVSVAVGEAHILNLCVDPDFQRRGLGRRMLEHLLHLARRHRAETAFLEVRESNQRARRLYFDAGFNEIGLRRNYYPAEKGREAAVILACELT